MPLYKIEIFKSIAGGKPWCNTYFWQDTTLASAVNGAADIADAEQEIHLTYVDIERARVSQVVPNTSDFTTLVLNITGSRSASANSIPLWNVFCVDFTVAGGRPSKKLLRGPVLVSDLNGEVLTGTGLTFVTNYINAITTSLSPDGIDPGIVDESGNPFDAVLAENRIRERSRTRRRDRSGGPPPS